MNDLAIDSYLTLLAKHLTRFEMEQQYRPLSRARAAQRLLARRGYALARRVPFDPEDRAEGRDWPATAETMIGLKRLANVRDCIETVLAEDVPGDILETGVWRGGASIYAAAVLAAHDADRDVWLADSFQGLPAPDTTRYGKDEVDLTPHDILAVSAAEVLANFDRYGLLSERVHFIEGWFSDTMPTAPIGQLAVLRLDGDLYSSTMDVLAPMYDKVSTGGFVVVDDYGAMSECERAVTDFRHERGITDEIHTIDWTGVYWRKSA